MKTSNLCHKIDGLINTYLFDIEYYSNTQDPESAEQLSESESLIRESLQQLQKEDLEFLYDKYSHQKKDLQDEIEWRRQTGKVQDPIKEEISQELSHLLKYISQCSEKAPRTTPIQRIMNASKPEEPAEEIETIQPKSLESIAEEQGLNIFTPVEPVASLPRYNEVTEPLQHTVPHLIQPERKPIKKQSSEPIKKSAEAPRKIASTPTVKRTESPVVKKSAPAGQSVKKTAPTAKTASVPKKPAKKTQSVEKIEWEELDIPVVSEAQKQETKIEQMIGDYLARRPQKSWQQRDLEQKIRQQKYFEEERKKREWKKQRELQKAAQNNPLRPLNTASKQISTTTSSATSAVLTWWDLFHRRNSKKK